MALLGKGRKRREVRKHRGTPLVLLSIGLCPAHRHPGNLLSHREAPSAAQDCLPPASPPTPNTTSKAGAQEGWINELMKSNKQYSVHSTAAMYAVLSTQSERVSLGPKPFSPFWTISEASSSKERFSKICISKTP